MLFSERVELYRKAGKIDEKTALLVQRFYHTYEGVLQKKGEKDLSYRSLFVSLLETIVRQIASPYPFGSFHKRIREPIDYYQLGIEIFRPMVDLDSSRVLGLENVERMERQLSAKDNVFLFANHQTELDPQVISLLLEKSHPRFAEEMIFVAGDRVVSDPIAIPFSLGRNLFCIYSKRHIDYPPERKEEKLRHNQRTMRVMEEMLNEGGKCIYVAPSGGRDRPNSEGVYEVASFDAQSLEMLLLIVRNASLHSTHFYPLALLSYPLLPPPEGIANELGEWRHTCYTPLYAAFGTEVDVEDFPGMAQSDKKERRQARADHLWRLVKEDYLRLKALRA